MHVILYLITTFSGILAIGIFAREVSVVHIPSVMIGGVVLWVVIITGLILHDDDMTRRR